MKKIFVLTSVHSALDGRIFHKECRSLARAGYRVTLMARHDREEVIDGVRIIPLPPSRNRLERTIRNLWKICLFSFREKADMYHFHDPDLIPLGILLKLAGRKVIYDVHEDVSQQTLNKKWIGNMHVRRTVAWLIRIMEKTGASLFDGIVAATEDIGNKFNPLKTLVIRNFPILELLYRPVAAVDSFESCSPFPKNRPAVVYSGGLTRTRGIREIIQAVSLLDSRVELWLLGDWEDPEYENECRKQEGWRYTRYFGVIPYGEHYALIKSADIGIINFLPVPNHENALPNKPFEYMAFGLPMVMSHFTYWRGIFADCALFANPSDPQDICRQISRLLDDPREAMKLGVNGKHLIEQEYNWEKESQKLITLYEKLLA